MKNGKIRQEILNRMLQKKDTRKPAKNPLPNVVFKEKMTFELDAQNFLELINELIPIPEDGKTPTTEELLALITPLIPKSVDIEAVKSEITVLIEERNQTLGETLRKEIANIKFPAMPKVVDKFKNLKDVLLNGTGFLHYGKDGVTVKSLPELPTEDIYEKISANKTSITSLSKRFKTLKEEVEDLKERLENINITIPAFGGGGSGGATSLGDLTDVELTSLANGDILMYNSTSGKWENEVLTGGGDMLKATYDPANGARQVAFSDELFSGDYDDLTNKPTIPTLPGVKNSIEIDGGSYQLVGDTASPGNNKVYGTNGSGVRVWKDDPAGGGSPGGAGGEIQFNDGGVFSGANGLNHVGGITEAQDSLFAIVEKTDQTKKVFFSADNITTSTSRTKTLQDTNGTLAELGNKLSAFASTTSAELAGVISDETGTGALVFAESPTLTGTPTLPATVNYTSNGSIVKSGNHALTLTTTGATNITFPTSGTLLNNSLTSANIFVGNGSNVATGVSMSGDVTISNTGAVTIANDAVTNSKLANMSNATIKGRHTSGTGDPEDLTASQVRSIINVKQSKSITIENPSASENISMFFTDFAITITKIVFVIRGTTSVTTTIRYDSDRSATGTEVVTGGTVVNSSTTGNVVTSFSSASIPADRFIWLETTALSGTPTELSVTIFYE